MPQHTTIIVVLLLLAAWASGQTATQPADVAPSPAPAATDDAESRSELPPPEPARPVVSEPSAQPAEPEAADTQTTLTIEEQLAIFDQLQQRILKLQLDLTKAEKQNERFRHALIESRETTGRLQSEINRADVLRQIQQREIRELRERLAAVDRSSAEPDDPTEVDAPATQPADDDERVDALVEIGRLKRRNETLELQLKLAAIEDENERTQKLIEQLRETSATLQKVEALRRELASLVVQQADEIRALRDRQRLLDEKLQAMQVSPPPAVPVENRPPVTSPDPDLATVEPPTTQAATAPPDRGEPTETPDAMAEQSKRIFGKLTEVDDVTLIINIGKEKGVEKGMRLIVFRDDKFVGYLEVVRVMDTTSAGTMVNRIRDPQVGDNVIDRLQDIQAE